MTRQEAQNRIKTHPYPDTRNGKKKIREEVWVDSMYGQPSQTYAENQRRKCLADYQESINGFFYEPEETGTFIEDPIDSPVFSRGYGESHIIWRYWIHYAVYA